MARIQGVVGGLPEGPSRLPVFPDGRPPTGPRVREPVIRTVAVLALTVTAAYLVWRAVATIDPRVWWLSIPLYLLELHAAIGLGLYVFSLWDVNAGPVARPVRETALRVAVLIPTWNEPEEVLAPTVAAAAALQPAHETWVLDDGDRPHIARLAADLGARYLRRLDRRHAKAGNLNHALEVIQADVVAVLDADHVARPDLLVDTLGYFDDPQVALVQTPQDFYNLESFEHSRTAARDGFNEQSLFYRAILAGKNRWGAAFWCGTNALLRVSALKQVGGVATGTVTEDIHTTIRLHAAGWRTLYHNQVLARGLAAAGASQYLLQRHRWGTGAMQVLRADNPLTVPGLSWPQRLSYAFTLFGWFDAWRSLGYLLVPIAVLFTGAIPIRAPLGTFAVTFAATFTLQQLALWLLGRGWQRPWLAILFDLMRLPSNLAATMALFGRRSVGFQVTPKGRTGERPHRTRPPRILSAVVLISAMTTAWFVATLAGRTPLHYGVRAATFAAAGWLAFNLVLVAAAIARIRSIRYGAERRASVRFPVSLPAQLDGASCTATDLSLTGARVSASSPLPGEPSTLVLEAPGRAVALGCAVRARIDHSDGSQTVAVEFQPGQWPAIGALTHLLFNAGVGLDVIPEPVPLGAVA
jgi:cellulose synthase/poly-beta-1,6-N-acetylglucosamine synthase-like glycosyltransferase